MAALNLTQHAATAEQRAAGVIDLPESARTELCTLLTFDALPTAEDIRDRAERIAEMASLHASPDDRADDDGFLPAADHGLFAGEAMIGGAPWLMGPLAAALHEQGMEPVFAFSVREAGEQAQPDGSVRKVAVFRHAGFVEAV